MRKLVFTLVFLLIATSVTNALPFQSGQSEILDELSVTLYSTSVFIQPWPINVTVVSVRNIGSTTNSLTLPNGARVNYFFVVVDGSNSYSRKFIGSILYLDSNGKYQVYQLAPPMGTELTSNYYYPPVIGPEVLVNFTPNNLLPSRVNPVKIRLFDGIWRPNFYQFTLLVSDGQTAPVDGVINKLGRWQFTALNGALSSSYGYVVDYSTRGTYGQLVVLSDDFKSPAGTNFKQLSSTKITIFQDSTWHFPFDFTCIDSDGINSYRKGEVGVNHPDRRYVSLIKDKCYVINNKPFVLEGACTPVASTIFATTQRIDCRFGCNDDYTGCRVPTIRG